MMTSWEESLVPSLLELARGAGEILISARKSLGRVFATKSDGSPVTVGDLKADAFVYDGLRNIGGDISIISEERPVPPYSIRRGWKEFWLLIHS